MAGNGGNGVGQKKDGEGLTPLSKLLSVYMRQVGNKAHEVQFGEIDVTFTVTRGVVTDGKITGISTRLSPF